MILPPPPFFLFSGILKTVFIFGLTFLPFSRFTYELHYGNDPLCCELNIHGLTVQLYDTADPRVCAVILTSMG